MNKNFMPPSGTCKRYQQHPGHNHVVDLPGLTPAALGPTLFQRVYHCTRLAAEHYANGCYSMAATYDPATHERTGYRVRVQDAMTALHIRIAHDLARKCQPMPWRTR